MPSNSPTNKPDASMGGTLYVVATPIGNRDDITLRALKILGAVDLVASEDTRHTGRLLSHHHIKARLIAFHDHNEKERTETLLARLRQGASVALVSDAGTPTVSDPGYHLVSAATAAGIRVVPVPGVSAATAALSVAGLPTDAFVFVGFPVRKKGKRREQLAKMATEARTMIFYESPKRITALLSELIEILGDRYGVLGREMTKLHEEFLRGPLSTIRDTLESRPAVKGELTLLVAGGGMDVDADDLLEKAGQEIEKALADPANRLSDIVKMVALKYNLPKKQVYDAALQQRARARQDDPPPGHPRRS